MADRKFNNIPAWLYDEDWSEKAILIAAMLFTHVPNEHGVFEAPVGKIKRFFSAMFDRSEIDEALLELEALGQVKWYNNRRCVWVVNKFSESKWATRDRNQLGALTYINKNHPVVLQEFAEHYHLMHYLSPDKTELSGYLVVEKVNQANDEDNLVVENLNLVTENPNQVSKNSKKTLQSDSDSDNKNKSKKPPKKKVARQKADAIPIPTLSELEEVIPADAFDEWLQFKAMCCRSNQSGEMADTRLAKILRPILTKAAKENLTGAALANGFMAATNARDGQGAPNSNYVLKAARGYHPSKYQKNSPVPTTSVEMPKSFKPPVAKA